MKKAIIIPLCRFGYRVVLPVLFLLMASALNGLNAQADSTETDEPSLISPSIALIADQLADNSINLKAELKAKVNGQWTKLYKMKVSFYQVAEDGDKELGFVISDGNGKAVMNVKPDSYKTDAAGKLDFKAVFAGNKSAEEAVETVSVKRAKLTLTPVKEDSILSVHVKAVEIAGENEIPVKEVTVAIFVKRLFLPLKVGEGTTDDNGEATIEFPNNLPGDAKGNLTLMARVDEHESFGNLEASVVQPWGIPVSDKIEKQPRALWSTSPPLWMLITFIVLMATVWGHYVVIIYELFRLRKEQPEIAEPNV